MQGLLQKPMAAAVRGGQPPAPPAPEASQAATQGNMADGDGMENVTAEEQTEYNRGMAAITRLVHGDPKSQKAVISQLDPKNPVGSIGNTAAVLISDVGQKLKLPSVVILPMVEEVVPLLAEAGEAAGKFQIKPGQAEQAVAVATEILLDQNGVTDEDYAGLINGMGPEDLKNMQTVYQGALNDG
jgi:hypothetical protein